jgi:hypothetical protein
MEKIINKFEKVILKADGPLLEEWSGFVIPERIGEVVQQEPARKTENERTK